MEETSSPSAEPWLQNTTPVWYCVRTHLKHEHIATAHLRQIPGVDVFHPQLRILRSTRRGRHWSNESLFPNYVFVRFILESLLERVTHTTAVKTILRFGDQVPAIPDAVIHELQAGMAQLNNAVLTDAPMEGEEVEIAAGAFRGMTGRVVRVLPGKERAQVLLNIMGQAVPAELNLDLLVVSRRDAAHFALERPATDVEAAA
jgi:transcription antitermination factor NusG